MKLLRKASKLVTILLIPTFLFSLEPKDFNAVVLENAKLMNSKENVLEYAADFYLLKDWKNNDEFYNDFAYFLVKAELEYQIFCLMPGKYKKYDISKGFVIRELLCEGISSDEYKGNKKLKEYKSLHIDSEKVIEKVYFVKMYANVKKIREYLFNETYGF